MSDEDNKKVEKITPELVRKKNLRPPPLNPLEINQSLIEPRIGRERLGQELERNFKVNRIKKENPLDGDEDYHLEETDAWDQLTTITSDVRLSNLGYNKEHTENELRYTKWANKSELMCLQEGYNKSALLAKVLLATTTESSLAKNGFLRNNLQTIRQESQHIQIEDTPKKKSLMASLFSRNNGGQ